MEPFYSGRYQFPGYFVPGECQIDIYIIDNAQHFIVVVTETSDNPSTSVSNAIVNIANKVVRDFFLDPVYSTFVTRYINESYAYRDSNTWERLAIATITWEGQEAKSAEFKPLRNLQDVLYGEVS